MLRSVPRIAAAAFRPTFVAALPRVASVSSAPLRRSMSVLSVRDDAELRTAISGAGEKLVIVDWSAKWCQPCKQIAPIYETLSDENKNVVFLKADIDVLSDASVEAGVQSVPTFHFIKNSEMVAEFAGADANKLKMLIQQHA
jgi:thioredoxin 1